MSKLIWLVIITCTNNLFLLATHPSKLEKIKSVFSESQAIINATIAEAERYCGAKVDSSPWAAFCGVQVAYFELANDRTIQRNPEILLYLQGMADCVFAPCPGDVQAFVSYKSYNKIESQQIVQSSRKRRQSNSDFHELYKFLMRAEGQCMMLYYGQAPDSMSTSRRRRSAESQAGRRKVNFASAFVQCVQSRVRAQSLSQEQENWFAMWVAGYNKEQTALCANAPNPSTQ